jgi:hypothetical protein
LNFRRSFIPLKPMEATPARNAWEPLTPRGVAAFAHAPWTRLLLVQFLVALLVGSTVAWLLHNSFFPTVSSALQQLPANGEIRRATLDWPESSPQVLAENRFLSLAVDLDHSGEVRSLAQFQVEFGRTNVLFQSLPGKMYRGYPAGWIIEFNQTELLPRWGAWRPVLLALAMAGVVVYLLVSWSILAGLYCGPVWMIGFYANRDLNLRASWQLACAALLPGAFVMLVALLFYGIGSLDLIHLGVALAVHLLVGWVYLPLSILFVPRLSDPTRAANPFRAEKK